MTNEQLAHERCPKCGAANGELHSLDRHLRTDDRTTEPVQTDEVREVLSWLRHKEGSRVYNGRGTFRPDTEAQIAGKAAALIERLSLPTEPSEDVAERVVARALLEARGLGPDTLHQHHEWEDYPTDAEQKYIGAEGEERTIVLHYAWRKRVPEAKAAIAALRTITPDRDSIRGEAFEAVWQQARENHANHSDTGSREQDIRFFALGLAGEAGEVANFVKKRWRDGDGHDDDLRKECADVFAYNIMLADALGMTATDLLAMVAYKQQVFVEKMAARALKAPSKDTE